MSALARARRETLLEALAERIIAYRLREPAIVLLTMHAPLAFLGGQMLFALQPFVTTLAGDTLARELPLLLEDPTALRELIARLEHPALPAPQNAKS